MTSALARAGFTLVELVVASGVGSGILVGLISGALALQRGYSAVKHQAECQEDQVRVIGFVTRDLRRATAVTLSNNNRQLTLTVPDPIEPVSGLLRTPTVVNGSVTYGGTPRTVSYFVSGTAFIRRENNTDTVLSTNRFGLENFFVFNEAAGANPPLLRYEISFVPKFSRSGVNAVSTTRMAGVVRLRNRANITVQ